MVATDEQLERFLVGCMVSLRADPTLARATFIIVSERNFGGGVGASRVCQICMDAGRPAVAFTQDVHRRPGDRVHGIVTSHESKEQMRLALATLLRVRSVHLAEPFISRLPDAREKLVDQLRGYRFEVKETKSTLKPSKVVLTGKGVGKSDDLCIAMNMLAFYPTMHEREGDRCLMASD